MPRGCENNLARAAPLGCLNGVNPAITYNLLGLCRCEV